MKQLVYDQDLTYTRNVYPFSWDYYIADVMAVHMVRIVEHLLKKGWRQGGIGKRNKTPNGWIFHTAFSSTGTSPSSKTGVNLQCTYDWLLMAAEVPVNITAHLLRNALALEYRLQWPCSNPQEWIMNKEQWQNGTDRKDKSHFYKEADSLDAWRCGREGWRNSRMLGRYTRELLRGFLEEEEQEHRSRGRQEVVLQNVFLALLHLQDNIFCCRASSGHLWASTHLIIFNQLTVS